MRALAFLASVVLAFNAFAAKPPQISFEKTAVVATGITPRGQVAFFSVAREPSEFVAVVVPRSAIVGDDDGDGRVLFDLHKQVPLRSIWVAVDLATGDYSLGTPTGSKVGELEFAKGKFKAGPKGKEDHFQFPTHFLEVFVVRPGVGAWTVSSADGDDKDDDGPANGSVSVSLEHMQPVGASPSPPEEFAAGDVFVVIDSSEMQAAVAQLSGGKK